MTKFRREILHDELQAYLRQAFEGILLVWRCQLLDFSAGADHVRLLVDAHPALDLSVLINNLKTASARRARNRFEAHLATFYDEPVFWHRAYFVSSVGEASLQAIEAYVHAQGTQAHPDRANGKRSISEIETKPLTQKPSTSN